MDENRPPGAAVGVYEGSYVLMYSNSDTTFEFLRSDAGLDKLARCLNLCPPTVVLCADALSQDEVSRLWDRCFGFGCSRVEWDVLVMLESVCKELVGENEMSWLRLLAMGARGFWVTTE